MPARSAAAMIIRVSPGSTRFEYRSRYRSINSAELFESGAPEFVGYFMGMARFKRCRAISPATVPLWQSSCSKIALVHR
jgi:hypothetical protein